MSRFKKEFDDNLLEDIQELCTCCAKSVVVIAKRYNEDPIVVNKLFLEVYKEINDAVENAK